MTLEPRVWKVTPEAEKLRINLHLTVALAEAPPRPFGAVTSHRIASVHDRHQQIAMFRCTEQGEWIGWGWVEHTHGGGRTEFHHWGEFYIALRHLIETRRAS